MPKTKKRKTRKINFKNVIILLLIVLLIIGGVTYMNYNNALKPVSKTSEQITFNVEQGQSSKAVLKNLEDAGLIKDAGMTYWYVKLNKINSIKAGEYVLDPSWDTKTILETISDSNSAIVYDTKVTIVEGDWAKDIAKKISENTNLSEEELLAAWNDETYVRELMNDYSVLTEDIFNDQARIYLEGYLCPNTYNFYQETTVDEVTRKILDQTQKIYDQYADQISKSGYSVHQIYTLSSIVQYESGTVEDMKIIAGVFYNRLNQNMMLQSSVTVCYAIDKDKEDDWKTCEVNPDFDSPYNTYKYAGLPPGPILNPGVDSIDATLNPTNSNYLYFMADVYGRSGTVGKVFYAETYAEHQANVNKYLK